MGEDAAMVLRCRLGIWFAAALLIAVGAAAPAWAQVTLQPIPAAECQKFAAQAQQAVGFAMKAEEDDFTDLTDGSDGRSCHIAGTAADQAFAGPGDLLVKIGAVFGGWRDDPARNAAGTDGAEKGYVAGDRIATVQVSWEPGPGVVCSDKQPLSACKVLPQQKLWSAIIDIVVKAAK
jgi:hypothetical protein